MVIVNCSSYALFGTSCFYCIFGGGHLISADQIFKKSGDNWLTDEAVTKVNIQVRAHKTNNRCARTEGKKPANFAEKMLDSLSH
ncbi:unnamed protein product [Hymenolepis diminuta]|uniref:Uncharacterized protein n=1 Tax=Hymenolepis diminuta TaxID=6216 RepID=A0A564Y706_HYMDI|nr:unnamed protein product [Hymenolepis diminuta]